MILEIGELFLYQIVLNMAANADSRRNERKYIFIQ